MRGTKAKRLRKQVYGSRAHQVSTGVVPYVTKYLIINESGTTKCVGARAEYLKLKKEAKHHV